MARILLVGDSITVGYPPNGGPGFRRWLKDATPDDTYVGPFESPAGSGLFHGGVGGATTIDFDIGGKAHLYDWIAAYTPDLVRFQLGTNDLVSFPHDPVTYVVDRITSIVATGAAKFPSLSWHISSIPLGGTAAFQTRVRAFNAALLDRVTTKEALRATAPHASFRDNCRYLNETFDAEGLTAVLTPPPDATHPNARGYALIARGILEQRGKRVPAAVLAAGAPPSTPNPGAQPPPKRPVPRTSGGGLGALVAIGAVGVGAFVLLRGRG